MDTYIDIKDGVKFRRFNKHFADLVLAVCRTWWFCVPAIIPTITSAHDGVHMDGSLHYKDLAWDLRTRNLQPDKTEEIARMLRVDLGDDWDVIVEKDHLHCEYDKGGL